MDATEEMLPKKERRKRRQYPGPSAFIGSDSWFPDRDPDTPMLEIDWEVAGKDEVSCQTP
jgi:hypothetical protein